MKGTNEAKYLGCIITDNGKPQKEFNKRKADAFKTWKRLAEFWKHGKCDLRFKLIVYDAVVRAKLMYGLDSIQLNKDYVNPNLKGKLDTFHLKGIRQILKLPTTFGQMKNNQSRTLGNIVVYNIANEKNNSYEARNKGGGIFRPIKKIIPLSEYYQNIRRKAIINLINEEEETPEKAICIKPGTLDLNQYNFKKRGYPHYHWWYKGLENYWEYIGDNYYTRTMIAKILPGNVEMIITILLGQEHINKIIYHNNREVRYCIIFMRSVIAYNPTVTTFKHNITIAQLYQRTCRLQRVS